MREGGRARHLKIALLEELWVSVTLRGRCYPAWLRGCVAAWLRGCMAACSVNQGACVTGAKKEKEKGSARMKPQMNEGGGTGECLKKRPYLE